MLQGAELLFSWQAHHEDPGSTGWAGEGMDIRRQGWILSGLIPKDLVARGTTPAFFSGQC